MKIAVCISGQLRKLEMNKIQKTFESFDTTYFIHTWENQYNPNLHKLKNYFHGPRTFVETERYEDVFDTLNYPNCGIDVFRYRYAQFYTIMKSFQMLASENSDRYDLIVRTRTDCDLVYNHFNDEFERMYKNLMHQIEWYHIHGTMTKDDFLVKNSPWLTTDIGAVGDYTVINDWFWIMNMPALYTLTKFSAVDIVNMAKEIKDNHKPLTVTEGTDFSSRTDLLKSPGVWSHIFKKLNIPIIHSPLGSTNVFEAKGRIVPGYGDIT